MATFKYLYEYLEEDTGEAYLYRAKLEWSMKDEDHEKAETENDSRDNVLYL